MVFRAIRYLSMSRLLSKPPEYGSAHLLCAVYKSGQYVDLIGVPGGNS